MRNYILNILTMAAIVFLFSGCAALSGGKVGSFLFSVEDDKKFGKQVSDQIDGDKTQFPVLDPAKYPEAYRYMNAMKNEILNSGSVSYKTDFAWELKIINKNVLNAFVTPGGYIYVYTGLIQYLDNADDLAGVLGHEIAHADRRHSIKQMEKQYGLQLLSSVVLGQNSGQLAEIASQIAGTGAVLAFSRNDEADADEYSVRFLSKTKYACNGAASFFQKLVNENKGGKTPEFLSTHPAPKSRVSDINKMATTIGCSTAQLKETGMTYQQLKTGLPK
jgi:predicted Zn-dependent protease